MAEEVQVHGVQAKLRSPAGVAVLTIVTLGIYGLFWWYYINREMADLGKARGMTEQLGDSPGKSLLALFPGALVLVPAIMTYIGTWKRMKALQEVAGVPHGDQGNGWIYIILLLVFSPLAFAYQQSNLNEGWEQLARGGGGALPSAAQPMTAPESPVQQPQQPQGGDPLTGS